MNDQCDGLTFRVVVFGRDATEILLARSHSGVRFPEVNIPQWRRVAANVGIAMKEKWNKEVICLFELHSPLASGDSGCIVVRHWRDFGGSATPLQRLPVTELVEGMFAEPGDYSVVQECLSRCRSALSSPDTEPFAQPSWFDELYEWVGQALVPKRLRLTGNFLQLNASPAFSLIRFETNGPAVWFKAVGEPNQHEFPITLTVTQLLPRHVPQILATHSSWNGWLMSELEGTCLDKATDQRLWDRAAVALAEMQIESIAAKPELANSSAYDLGIGCLRELISPFMEFVGHLMEKQLRVPPEILDNSKLRVLSERVRHALSLWEDLGIPDTLGLLDPNPANLIVSQKACGFLDWAEAYVGPPFLTLQYLLEHLHRKGTADSIDERKMVASYLSPWQQVVPSGCAAVAGALSPLLAVVAYTIGRNSWRKPEYLSDAWCAGYLRGLVRRMDSEARKLSNRRILCSR